MPNKTTIDWPSLAYTLNPIVGCNNACPYCYAKKINDRFKMIPDFSKPQFFPERLNQIGKIKKPSTIFIGSMCDIFSEGVASWWVQRIVDTVKNFPDHTFMFLTKIPIRYQDFFWPINCWLGATVESDNRLYRYRSLIEKTEKNFHFLSIEPILDSFPEGFYFADIDLVIIGADSTPGAEMPKREWIESIEHDNIWYKESIRKIYPEFKNKEQ